MNAKASCKALRPPLCPDNVGIQLTNSNKLCFWNWSFTIKQVVQAKEPEQPACVETHRY